MARASIRSCSDTRSGTLTQPKGNIDPLQGEHPDSINPNKDTPEEQVIKITKLLEETQRRGIYQAPNVDKEGPEEEPESAEEKLIKITKLLKETQLANMNAERTFTRHIEKKSQSCILV